MSQLFVLTLALLAGTCYAGISSRIMGGHPTTIDNYPSIVQVEFQGVTSGTWSQNCGANVINTRCVLSAAQCFSGELYHARFRRIRAGATYRNTGGLVIAVQQAINHPTFGQNGFDGDISVILLSGVLVYSPAIQQATIISQGLGVPDNREVITAGWGRTRQYGEKSPVLQDVTLTTINRQTCALRYSTILANVTNNMMCAGRLNLGGADTCEGDAGGPLYFLNLLVGISSWGHGCGERHFPGVFTAVSAYTNWIRSVSS